MHGSGDMYFYIVRGIQLLAEGERRNKRSPDMRYQIAFYYQNKFGVSDQVDTLRCLFDLSCIPPSERNPANLRDPRTGEVNLAEFRKFCEKNPHFVRRLRGEKAAALGQAGQGAARAPTPDDVIRFLQTNRDVPSRYKGQTDDLADADKQFPVLPPRFAEGPNEAYPAIATPDDAAKDIGYFSGFKAARAWFSYSLVLLPPPAADEQGEPLPGPISAPGFGGHDPSKHRIPRLPMLIIFRQGAPRRRATTRRWSRRRGGSTPRGGAIEDWFPDRAGGAWWSAPSGRGRRSSGSGRPRCGDQHGRDYGLALSPERYASLQAQAGDPTTLPADPTVEQYNDPAIRRRYMATEALRYYRSDRQTTNFPYFLASAEAEARVTGGRPLTVLARKTLWQADEARKTGATDKALRLYKDGLEQWKRVLADNPTFHRLPPPDRSDQVEEETFEYEVAYLRLLVQDDERVRERANRVAHGAHAVVPFLTLPFPKDGGGADPLWSTANREEIKWFIVENVAGADFSSPFVGSTARDGTPWVRDDVKQVVLGRQGTARRAEPPPPVGAPAPLIPQPPPKGPNN